MTRQTKIVLKNICLGLSSFVTIVGFNRAVDDDPGIGVLIVFLWGTGPYLLFWLVTYLLERFTSIRQVPAMGLGISLLIVVYAFAVYFQPLDHKSSTEGLIFIFAPLWLYISVLPLLGFCLLIALVSNRQIASEAKDKSTS